MYKANPPLVGPKTVEVIRTDEKGSDVNLATYLLLDAFKKECDTAIVISNDSDLCEPIALAQKELGVKVGVVNPHPAKYRSRALKPTFFKQLRYSILKDCQFPDELTDAKGTIRLPDEWR